jgi:hypothetical protein
MEGGFKRQLLFSLTIKAELMAHFLCNVSFGLEEIGRSILEHTSSRSRHREWQVPGWIGVQPMYPLLTAMLDRPY